VTLIGEKQGTFPVARYFEESGLRRRTLVTGVSFRERRWFSAYYRDTRTHFDYSAFTITVLIEKDGGRVADARVVVVGCAGKIARLQQLEDALKGRSAEDTASIPYPSVSFTGKKFMSPEYLSHVARVELERGIVGILRDRRPAP
jgi:CO/xanthine dehydrogenase FAD-binding subunit